MESDNPSTEPLFVYSEAQVDRDKFAIGLVPKDAFAEVRADYLEPILASRFPLNLLHPDSVVHLLYEGPLLRILSLRPTAEGVFVAVLPRRISAERETFEETLREAGFAPLDELRWQLEVKPG